MNILPGRDGLLHISKMDAKRRVNRVEDYLDEGDALRVVVGEIDRGGKVSLDLVGEIEPKPGADVGAPREGGGGRDRGDRGGRDRGDRGGRDRGGSRDRDGQDRGVIVAAVIVTAAATAIETATVTAMAIVIVVIGTVTVAATVTAEMIVVAIVIAEVVIVTATVTAEMIVAGTAIGMAIATAVVAVARQPLSKTPSRVATCRSAHRAVLSARRSTPLYIRNPQTGPSGPVCRLRRFLAACDRIQSSTPRLQTSMSACVSTGHVRCDTLCHILGHRCPP